MNGPSKKDVNTMPTLKMLGEIVGCLSIEDQRKFRDQFENVRANFEFFTWLELTTVQEILDEANQRRFTVAAHTSPTDAVIYGAGIVDEETFADTMIWLREITIHGQKGHVRWAPPNSDEKNIEFDSSDG